ncbi:ABC transporter permease [Dactylosporangium sp. AC04546]|uniref:ABC transporter permease n=1 Tax=Dactylosporangium sp. AC04546 TaxID=2862460 RepID=UPI001EDE5622|nr:ABC transporter permease [Dactylosporangium sp. AC04546]WVK79007.1 ABC transporter permease [Dactylosporangium sp. AC04546]
MDQVLLFVTLGFAAGSVYAVIAASIVSLHAATGVLNFAQGSFALWGVWVVAELRRSGTLVLPAGSVPLGTAPMTAWAAVAIGVLYTAALALAAHWLVFRPLRSAPPLSQVVASVGLMLAIAALVPLRFPTSGALAEPLLTDRTLAVGGTFLNVSDLVLLGVAVTVAAALSAYFRFTRWGVATRASAEDERAARLTGLSPDRLAGVMWVITGAATSVVAVLAAPTLGLDPIGYMFYVLPGLAAALLARLTSVVTACAAGLAIGCLQSILMLLSTNDGWPTWAQAGFGEALPFVLVVVALVVLGRHIPARGALGTVRMPAVTLPRRPWTAAAGLAAAAAVAVAFTSGSWRFGVVTSVIMGLIALSLVVLTGYLGQISLASMAFAGTGGFVLSRATVAWGVPFPLSILLSAGVATLVGVAVGLPALRIRGAQLAVVTLAGAVALQQLVFANPALTPFEGNLIDGPTLFGWDLEVRRGTDLTTAAFSATVIVIVGLLVAVVARLLGGATGQSFLAIRSNERAAASAGIDVARTKLAGFALSAFLAGVGGCLIGYSRSQLSVESFNVVVGLSVLCMAYVGGITRIGGAVIAGLIAPLGVLYTLLGTTFGLGRYYTLIAACALVVTAVLNPSGIAHLVRRKATA